MVIYTVFEQIKSKNVLEQALPSIRNDKGLYCMRCKQKHYLRFHQPEPEKTIKPCYSCSIMCKSVLDLGTRQNCTVQKALDLIFYVESMREPTFVCPRLAQNLKWEVRAYLQTRRQCYWRVCFSRHSKRGYGIYHKSRTVQTTKGYSCCGFY